MKLEEALNIAKSSERIPFEAAEKLLEFGITEFLKEGLQYSEAVEIISRAELAVRRQKSQEVSFR